MALLSLKNSHFCNKMVTHANQKMHKRGGDRKIIPKLEWNCPYQLLDAVIISVAGFA